MDEIDDELIQEQRALESQMPGLTRVPSEVSTISSVPMSDTDSQTGSPPRQRRRLQQPDAPIRGVGTPDRYMDGTFGSYSPRNMDRLARATAPLYDFANERRLARATNPFYEKPSAPVGSAERALEDMMGEDDSSVVSGSSGSQSVDLFGANQLRGRPSPEPLPLTRMMSQGDQRLRRMELANLAEIPEMEEELQGPVRPGGLFADTFTTPKRNKKGGIKSKSKRSKSKRGKVTRKTKRKTRKFKKHKMKKRKTIKKKKKSRR